MTNEFIHPASDLLTKKPLVFSAFSKHLFYFRMHISKFILEQACVPLNPFMTFDYFLLDTVDRNVIREGNNNLVLRADQLWTFGEISDGVLTELLIVKRLGKPIRFFDVIQSKEIIEIQKDQLQAEQGVPLDLFLKA